jgi:hypothetical protein
VRFAAVKTAAADSPYGSRRLTQPASPDRVRPVPARPWPCRPQNSWLDRRLRTREPIAGLSAPAQAAKRFGVASFMPWCPRCKPYVSRSQAVWAEWSVEVVEQQRTDVGASPPHLALRHAGRHPAKRNRSHHMLSLPVDAPGDVPA